MWQRLARESVSKAGQKTPSLSNRSLAWVSVRAVPPSVRVGDSFPAKCPMALPM